MLPEKGRGVFAAEEFKRGDLICEYAGELIDYSLGKVRETEYSQNPELGCYSYFFQYKSKKYWYAIIGFIFLIHFSFFIALSITEGVPSAGADFQGALHL